MSAVATQVNPDLAAFILAAGAASGRRNPSLALAGYPDRRLVDAWCRTRRASGSPWRSVQLGFRVGRRVVQVLARFRVVAGRTDR